MTHVVHPEIFDRVLSQARDVDVLQKQRTEALSQITDSFLRENENDERSSTCADKDLCPVVHVCEVYFPLPLNAFFRVGRVAPSSQRGERESFARAEEVAPHKISPGEHEAWGSAVFRCLEILVTKSCM